MGRKREKTAREYEMFVFAELHHQSNTVIFINIFSRYFSYKSVVVKAKNLSEGLEEWLIILNLLWWLHHSKEKRLFIYLEDQWRKDSTFKKEKGYFLWSLRDTLGIINNQQDFNVHFGKDLSFSVFYHFIQHKK